jgi:hypothetical protein
MGCAQPMPFGAVAQHVQCGGEHRGGHGHDGFFDAAGALVVEVRLQIAALDLDGRPSGLASGPAMSHPSRQRASTAIV